MPVRATGGIVPDPPQAIVRHTRSRTAAASDLFGRIPVDADRQFPGVPQHQGGQFFDRIEPQMFAELKAIPERSGQHARPRGGADKRERFEPQVMRAQPVHALPQHNIDPKVLHGRVQVFLHGRRQTMNFVNKEHRTFFGVGQVRDQVLGRFENRATGQLHGDSQLAGNARGKGGLTEPGRPVKQHVPQRLAPLARGVNRNAQAFTHVALANHVLHALGAQVLLELVVRRGGGYDFFTHHNRGLSVNVC